MKSGFVLVSLLSKYGKSVNFCVTDLEHAPWSRTVPEGFAGAVIPGIWAGVLSVHPMHQKSGYIKFQDFVRRSTGWKIGILDIERMVSDFNMWKVHLQSYVTNFPSE